MATVPEGATQLAPYLLYRDAEAAIDFLTSAFGFRETLRMADGGGRVFHAELWLDEGKVLLGSPGEDYQGPAATGIDHSHVYAYVDDVDAHCEQARAAGATIVEGPADQPYGERRYHALDPEGHTWFFATRI